MNVLEDVEGCDDVELVVGPDVVPLERERAYVTDSELAPGVCDSPLIEELLTGRARCAEIEARTEEEATAASNVQDALSLERHSSVEIPRELAGFVPRGGQLRFRAPRRVWPALEVGHELSLSRVCSLPIVETLEQSALSATDADEDHVALATFALEDEFRAGFAGETKLADRDALR